jgi:hypothetical protein
MHVDLLAGAVALTLVHRYWQLENALPGTTAKGDAETRIV